MSNLIIDGIPILMSQIDLYEIKLDGRDRPYKQIITTPEPSQTVLFDCWIYDPDNAGKIRCEQIRFFVLEFTYRNGQQIKMDARIQSTRIEFNTTSVTKINLQGYGVIV